MNKAFTRENDGDEDEDADGGTPLPPLPQGARNYITPGGYARLKDELDEIVHELAKKYCEIFGINFAYGVEEWRIEWKSVNIRLD